MTPEKRLERSRAVRLRRRWARISRWRLSRRRWQGWTRRSQWRSADKRRRPKWYRLRFTSGRGRWKRDSLETTEGASMTYPPTFRYTKDDEWVDVKGEMGTVGLTYEAQCRLGDIVFLELPAVGAVLEAGKPLGVVESVKAVFEIFAPVSGEVVEVNGELKDAPEKVNSDPHGAGWLIKVRLKNPAEADALMDAATYEAYATSPARESSH